jgi:hypothetical protein
MEISEQIKKAKNEYMRQWRAKNKDKLKKIQDRYWEKKAVSTNN